MVRFMRAGAFVLVVLMAIAVIRPFNAADTFAAEPTAHRVVVIDAEPGVLRPSGQTYETTARTVGAFLEEMEIELNPYDSIVPSESRRIEERTTIRIDRAFYIDVSIDGRRDRRMVSPSTTAGGVLGTVQLEREVALIYHGDKDAILRENDRLEFFTWRSEQETRVEPIQYPTEYSTTPSLSRGVEQVRQEGIMGEIRTEYMVVHIGNDEYTREVLEESITDPVPEIVDIGIGGSLGTLTDTNCPSFRYARRLTMNASAYTAGVCCTGKGPGHPLYGITASGRRVEHGIVAVDPRVIPLGTRLYVEGYGFALAADTGSAILGYKIDLFMYDIVDARRFGRRDITVFVLD